MTSTTKGPKKLHEIPPTSFQTDGSTRPSKLFTLPSVENLRAMDEGLPGFLFKDLTKGDRIVVGTTTIVGRIGLHEMGTSPTFVVRFGDLGFDHPDPGDRFISDDGVVFKIDRSVSYSANRDIVLSVIGRVDPESLPTLVASSDVGVIGKRQIGAKTQFFSRSNPSLRHVPLSNGFEVGDGACLALTSRISLETLEGTVYYNIRGPQIVTSDQRVRYERDFPHHLELPSLKAATQITIADRVLTLVTEISRDLGVMLATYLG
ncbi:hypothetical protein HY990_02965 [Candidatus Micrarchaeota archaeon]|nr:hypothetical protein [Candidatus Micrarchaeota archaeon]